MARRTAAALKLLWVMALPVAASTLRQSLRGSSSHISSGIVSNSQAKTGMVRQCRPSMVLCGGSKDRKTLGWPRDPAVALIVSTSRLGSVIGTTIPKRSSVDWKLRRTNQ